MPFSIDCIQQRLANRGVWIGSLRNHDKIESIHVVVLKRTAKKYTKSYNARAEPLFRPLNLLFTDVLVAVAVVPFIKNQTWKSQNLEAMFSVMHGEIAKSN